MTLPGAFGYCLLNGNWQAFFLFNIGDYYPQFATTVKK
jgi:hypothetical protein